MKRGRLFLIEWESGAAAKRAAALQADGWTVDVEAVDGARAVKHMREDPPDVLAIDLSRLPSHGRETGRAVRGLKDLRDIPIVFFGGAAEAQSRAAAVVPGATFTSDEELPHVIARLAFRSAGS